jgi:uncharacterized membrane protein YadS
MATFMDDAVSGTWIGVSVDRIGNVIVVALILSDEAAEVASVVKIILNAGLGFLLTVIGCWWNSRQTGEEEKEPVTVGPETCKMKLRWSRIRLLLLDMKQQRGKV